MLGHPLAVGQRIAVIGLILILSSLATGLMAQTTSGTLLGAVRDKRGKGVPETKISVENEENGNLRATRTDDTGNYALFNLPPGTYKISASRDGFREQTIKSLPIQFNQKNVIRLPLFTLLTATLNGKVVDSLARILPNAKVVVASEDGSIIQQAFTDRNGEYSISDLVPGKYILTASWTGARGEFSGASTISLTEEATDIQFVEILFPGRLRESRNQVAKQSRTDTQTAQFQQARFDEATAAERNPGPNNRPASTAQQPKAPGPSYQNGEEAATLVHTADVARTSNFTERQVNALPVGGATAMRSFDEFALLVPGVAPPPYTPGVRGPGVGFGIGTAGQFSVNGMRARSNNFSVDGSDNNDPDVGMRRQGFVALVPQPIESMKEISISTLLWDAELGRNFSSQVNAVTKYGGQKYHGQLFALFTDSRLNARNFFDTSGKTPFTRTQAGLTFSGPISRNRTQFFLSYEHDQTRASLTEHFSSPTVAERRFQGGGTILTHVRRISSSVAFTDALPLGREVLSLYPLPNNPNGPYGANTFTTRTPADNSGDILSIKLTHQISLSSFLSGRLNFTDDGRVLPSVNQAIRSTLDSRTRSHNFSLIWDQALGHTISNQARFSFGRTLLNFCEYPNNPFIFSAAGSADETLKSINRVPLTTGTADTGPLGELLIEPFSPVGVNAFTFPQRRASNTFQYADSVSWSAGNHSIKFGASIRRYQLNSVLDRLYRPEAVFGYGTLNNLQTLIPGVQVATLGVPSAVLQTITLGAPDSTIGLRFTEYHGFVNDNWRIRSKLVLDYGLRYEYNTVPREVNNRIESALRLENIPPSGHTNYDTFGDIHQFNDTIEAYRQILDGRKRMYDPDYNNFAPRAGVAWTIDDSGKTVIRGGYGIYYDAILGAVVSQSRNVFPNEIQFSFEPGQAFSNPFAFNNPARFPAFGQDVLGVFLLAQTPCNQFGTCNRFGLAPEDFAKAIGRLFAFSNGLAFTLPEKKLRSPYAQQWHLTAEREILKGYLLSVAYVGTSGKKLTRLTTPNLGKDVTPNISLFDAFPQPPEVSVNLALIPFRPNPNLGPYQIFENSANSIYHALQLEARKRYSHNYQFTAAYTWSHAIDDVSDLFPIAGAPVIAQDSFNLRAERGDANFDIRHRFAASLLWDLPFYRNSSSGAGRLLKNWQIASIFQANTGQPFTLNLPVDANLDGNLTDRPSTTNGLIFLTGHGPQRIVLASGRELSDFFTFGSNGAVGRNTARGDNFIDLDLSVNRTFRFGETKNLLFRAEFFNLFNRANFGLPIRVIGAPGFGSSVDTIVPARNDSVGGEIQFLIKQRRLSEDRNRLVLIVYS
jgi:hypothetical protein